MEALYTNRPQHIAEADKKHLNRVNIPAVARNGTLLVCADHIHPARNIVEYVENVRKWTEDPDKAVSSNSDMVSAILACSQGV